MGLRFFFAVMLLLPSFTGAQDNGVDSIRTPHSSGSVPGLNFLFSFFPPFFIQHGMELKSFIRSEEYRRLCHDGNDMRGIDAIFLRAMALTSDNTAVALLISTFACFDHRVVGLRNPIFALYLPLSDESEDEFSMRVNNLPRMIYPDTKRTRRGDRDKLQHFFGSAFVANIFESAQPAEGVSDFVEKGEDLFIVDGAYDIRDIRSNHQGQEFGLALLKNNHRLPSEFLTLRDSLQSR